MKSLKNTYMYFFYIFSEMENQTLFQDSYYNNDQNDTLLQQDLDFELMLTTFQYYVEGVGIIVIGSIGVIINMFAFYILFRKHVSTHRPVKSGVTIVFLFVLCLTFLLLLLDALFDS